MVWRRCGLLHVVEEVLKTTRGEEKRMGIARVTGGVGSAKRGKKGDWVL